MQLAFALDPLIIVLLLAPEKSSSQLGLEMAGEPTQSQHSAAFFGPA